MGSGKILAQDDVSEAKSVIEGADQKIESQDSGAETLARNEGIIESVRQCHVRMLEEDIDKLLAVFSERSPLRVTKQESEERRRVLKQEREAICGQLSL
jgi:predicted thioredoxin/glutaredoxin